MHEDVPPEEVDDQPQDGLVVQELEEERIPSDEREQVQRIGLRRPGDVGRCADQTRSTASMSRATWSGVERVFHYQVAVAFELFALRIRESDPLSFAEHHGVPLALDGRVRADGDYRPVDRCEGSR